MQTLEWTTIDKADWGTGEWQTEPDKRQWLDDATGLPCLAVRHPVLGHWCGYVGVTEGHPYFGKDYHDDLDLSVHGGITFGGFCHKDADPSKGICHLVESGENDRVWWLGFDCTHCYDLSPASFARSGIFDGEYRSLSYVEQEVRTLAEQLQGMAA